MAEMNARERHIVAIRALEREYKSAGYIHKKDLKKHINRMKKELKIYDFYMRQGSDRRLRDRENTLSG